MNGIGLRLFAACIVASALAGCGSTPPTAWYVLSARQAPAQAAAEPTLGIVAIDVAEYLLAPQILAMDGANRVRRAEFARWAEPLDEGIARVLAQDLAAELGSQGVRLAPWPREWVPRHELRVRIQQLDAYPDRAELVAAWSLSGGGQAPRDRLTRLSRPRSGSDAEATAADFSALLGELAVAIAADLRAN